MKTKITDSLKEGQELFLAGRYKDAITIAKKHLKKHPHDLEMLRLLSASYYSSKNFSEAVNVTHKIIELGPTNAESLFNLCHLYCLLEQYEEAEKAGLAGLEIAPNNPLGLQNLSAVYLRQEKRDAAKELLNTLIDTYPQHATAKDCIQLASLLSEETDSIKIINLQLFALKKEPNYTTALNNLIGSATRRYEHCLVIQAIEKLLTIDRSKLKPLVAMTLATALFDMGYLDQAVSMFAFTLSLKEDARARASYGMALLGNGQYEAGWHEYLARIDIEEVGYKKHNITSKLWQGEELNGKTLVVLHEQGLGDNIQFIRFLPELKKKYNVNIIFKCQVALASLAKQIPGIDNVITKNDDVPEHDYHVLLLSLPLYLKIFSIDQFLPEPYIKADADLIDKWESLVYSDAPLKIGFCWSGSKTHAQNKRRNCALEQFLFLCTYAQILPVSLQKELTDAEKTLLKQHNIVNAGAVINDFADTAAIIHHLDLIITIDTSVFHLAAAMGKPVWLLMTFQTEWRHPRGIAKSPWYKDVSFFRQPSLGNWPFVFQLIEKNLQAYMQLNL